MRGAIILLIILFMGMVAAQSISLGYNATDNDKLLLQTIYTKVDDFEKRKPAKLVEIEEKLPDIISLFRPYSKEHYILSSIHGYIRTVIYPFNSGVLAQGIVTSLADQF